MLALASASTSYTLNGLSSRRAATTAPPQLTMAESDTNWAALPLAAALAATTISSAAHAAEPWAYSTLVNNIETDSVAKVVFAPDGQVAVAIDPEGADHAVQLFPEAQLELVHSLRAHETPFAVQPKPTKGALETLAGGLGSLLASLAPTLLFLGGLNLLASRGGMGGMPGGMGGGAGGMPEMLSKLMSNPKALALFQKAQSNPKMMAVLQEAQQAGFSPALLSKYAGDPEVQAFITEFQQIMG